jgi:hypothetical protein
MLGITIAPISLITDLSAIPLEDFGLTRTLGIHLSTRIEDSLAEDLVAAFGTAAAETMKPGRDLAYRVGLR